MLSLVTVLFWSTLPIALKVSLEAVDAWSLTWLRFAFAAAVTWLLLRRSARPRRSLTTLSRGEWLWLLLAGLMLAGNYVFFLYGLDYTSPGNAQVFIQLAPLLMALGGVLLLGERFSALQTLGAFAILCGLLLFFNDQISVMVSGQYRTGLWIMVAAAITWAVYALIQKSLSASLSSQSVLLLVYLVATVVLLPGFRPAAFTDLSVGQWLAVAYACINTVVAYGAFAEAIRLWNASRVGMVLALTPAVTLLVINSAAWLWPTLVQPEQIHAFGWGGLVLIVSGSMLASLSRMKAA